MIFKPLSSGLPEGFNPIVTLPDEDYGYEWFDGAIATYSDAKGIWPIWLITKFPLLPPIELKGIAV